MRYPSRTPPRMTLDDSYFLILSLDIFPAISDRAPDTDRSIYATLVKKRASGSFLVDYFFGNTRSRILSFFLQFFMTFTLTARKTDF